MRDSGRGKRGVGDESVQVKSRFGGRKEAGGRGGSGASMWKHAMAKIWCEGQDRIVSQLQGK